MWSTFHFIWSVLHSCLYSIPFSLYWSVFHSNLVSIPFHVRYTPALVPHVDHLLRAVLMQMKITFTTPLATANDPESQQQVFINVTVTATTVECVCVCVHVITYINSASHLGKSLYVRMSRLGMQLFRALRANVGITCVGVTLRNVTGVQKSVL